MFLRQVHTSTIKRTGRYGLPGLFFWPLLVPAIVDGLGSEKANEKLDADFVQKSLHVQIVRPYSLVNGLILVSY